MQRFAELGHRNWLCPQVVKQNEIMMHSVFSIITWEVVPFFGWGHHSCGISSPTLIFSTCTRLIILAPTFLSLMRNLCLSSALLLETCGAASNVQSLSLSVWCSFTRFYSHSPTSSMWFERGKTSCYDDDSRMVQPGLLICLTGPAVFAQP